MEQISHAEQTTSAATFEDIVVDNPNAESTIMAKCINCNIVTVNGSFNKWTHWKYTCPFKMLFRFNYPSTNPNTYCRSDMTITCLVCHEQFFETTILFMTAHRKHCKEENQVEHSPLTHRKCSTPETIPPSLQTVDTNESITTFCDVSSSDSTTTTTSYRIESTDMNRMRFSIKKTNILDANESGQCVECRMCKCLFVTDSMNQLQTCNKCNDGQLEGDVLFTVQTIHTNELDQATTDNLDSTQSFTPNQNQVCFICNSATSESYVDLYGTVAAHSGKCIFDFVWKFLGNKPSVRNELMDASCLTQEVVCLQCVGMINQYDKAHVTKKWFKKILRNKLTSTENYFMRLQNRANGSTTTEGNQLNESQTENTDKSTSHEAVDSSDEN